MGKGKILVVDDNSGVRAALKLLLARHFDAVELISSPKLIPERIRDFKPDAVLLDMNFETEINTGNEGLFWLNEIKRDTPSVQVVLFTAYADIAIAVEGMKRGAFDFVVKPYSNEKLVNILKSACIKSKKDTNDNQANADNGLNINTIQNMYWGTGPAMVAIRNTVTKIAPTDVNVLITGENGTGKDVLAHEIHRLSGRSLKPMVCVDVGAITETLFESELFGHVKGAFTDAHNDHTGKFEQANGGTLFLDEIGNIPITAQAKLLRVLQARMVNKVGDTKQIPIDIRLICATNRNLDKMVADKHFRQDLLYRLNTISINLPPLRERIDEIFPLANMFVSQFSKKYRRNISGIDQDGLRMLQQNPWSGNIRELRNCIEKAVILADKPILTASDFVQPNMSTIATRTPEHGNGAAPTEEQAIRQAMEHCAGNLTKVAKMLKISRPTLYSKLKKYNI